MQRNVRKLRKVLMTPTKMENEGGKNKWPVSGTLGDSVELIPEVIPAGIKRAS